MKWEIARHCTLLAVDKLGSAEALTPEVATVAVPVALFVVYPLVMFAAEGALRRMLVNLVPFVAFSMTWIYASFMGLVRVRRRVWTHTRHGAAATAKPATDPSAPPGP